MDLTIASSISTLSGGSFAGRGDHPVWMPTSIASTATIGKKKYSLIAFYHPGSETLWDKKYNANFLANYFSCPVTLTLNGTKGNFKCAEAAYQALKWWNRVDAEGIAILPQFEACKNGCDAYRLRSRLAGSGNSIGEVADWDRSFMGLQRDGAMLAVAAAKFSQSNLKMALIATGNAYLLEHSRQPGKDFYWSVNHDGSGNNCMGKLLMKLRSQLGGVGSPAPEVSVENFTSQVAY